MALTSLRYLQDDQDPLNALLAGGGQPSVPDPQTDPAGEQQPQPADDTPANPYRGELEQSLLNAPPPAAKGGDYTEPMPVKMRDSYAQPGAAAPPDRGGSKDPELDAAYRSAQMDALQHAKFDDKGYGVAEGLRDNGAALLASILDIGFNKGRGLGGIVGATAQEVGRQADSREKERKAAQDFALAARKQRDDGLGQQRLDYLYASLANKKDAQGGAQDRFDARRNDVNDPNSQRNTTAQQQAFNTALARGQGTQEATHQYNPTIATDRANIAGAEAAASTGARIGTEHDNAPITTQDASDLAAAQQGARIQTDLNYAPQTTDAAAQKAAAVAQAQIAPELQKQQGMNPILADRSNNGVGAGLSADGLMRANPGLDVSDPQLLQQAMKTRQINQKTLDDIKAANRGSEIVERLHDTAETYQALVTNDASAIAGPQAAELRRQYKAHAEEYAGVIGRVSGNNSMTSHKEALDLVPDIHNPYATDGIKGLWSPLEANINGNLGAIGIRARAPAFMGDGQQPQPPAAAPQPQPGAAAPQQSQAVPGYSTDYSDPRTSLGAPQALPSKPSSEGRQVRTIVNVKTGRPTQTMMTDAELAPAIQSGAWRLGN